MSQLADIVNTVKVHGYRHNISKEHLAELLDDITSDLEWDIVEERPFDPATGDVDWGALAEEHYKVCLALIQ